MTKKKGRQKFFGRIDELFGGKMQKDFQKRP